MNLTIAAISAVSALGASLIVSACSATIAEAPRPSDATSAQHQHESMQETVVTKIKHGKYEVELLVPEEGIFAGEEMDLEFRVTDSTQKDPVEGNLGIANVEAKGVVTMPAMPGMPSQIPDIHREGIPGYYGIVLYFPHGGGYQIDLQLTLPDGEKFPAVFKVEVQDERPADMAMGKKPYALSIVDFPKNAKAGESINLKLQVKDTKTGKVQSDFQIVHEMKFHLLIASEDLGWFVHEHPKMANDGTWSIPLTFPASGKYFVYGDVAPAGKSSQLLISEVNVANGPKPNWNTSLVPTLGPTSVHGIVATLNPLDKEIPIGKNTVLEVQLRSPDGKPVLDTVPWLGAAGHMMIIHEGGQTVVHSHPKEDPETVAMAKQGNFRFMGRFPKPGLYKAYAQFSHQGEIKTFGFVLDIK
ncbi:MAG: FixH family protein [Fimbriimonadaceae bacterium]|nr:FixH family protein [Fimbriimonadaceae bacterium]